MSSCGWVVATPPRQCGPHRRGDDAGVYTDWLKWPLGAVWGHLCTLLRREAPRGDAGGRKSVHRSVKMASRVRWDCGGNLGPRRDRTRDTAAERPRRPRLPRHRALPPRVLRRLCARRGSQRRQGKEARDGGEAQVGGLGQARRRAARGPGARRRVAGPRRPLRDGHRRHTHRPDRPLRAGGL